MATLQAVELGVLGPLEVRQHGALVTIPGAKPRAILTMLGLHGGSVVPADAFVELLWSEDPPRTAAKALQTHISALRRTLGDGFVVTQGSGWSLAGAEIDALRYRSAARLGRDAAATGDTSQAVACFEEALALWRGLPELPDSRRGTSEKTRWIEGHAALVEDRADALLATGRAAEIIGELESAVADSPLRERRWGQLMLALYRAGRQGDALGAYQRARGLLAEELGVDPGPELRRLEAAIVAQDSSLEVPAAQNVSSVVRAVTFLLTDIEGSTAAWEADAAAMASALARHDELIEQVVTARGGRLIKTRGEGDATFSVFDRPSAAAAAALEVQDAIVREPWGLREPMRIRVALHTGEVEMRDGDYFGRAVNRAARLRSLAEGGQIVCSGATAELVIDSLADDVVLIDRGMRQLRNLARPEHVFELRMAGADERRDSAEICTPMERPSVPAVLAGPGPFVGRGSELEHLSSAWQTTLGGGTNAVLIAGEPGVGKTRLAGEWSRQAYDEGAVVLYGRCDEDLGAPYQPFAEALRSLVPCLGPGRLRGLRGVEALLPLVPGLTDLLPDLAAPTRADPDTERYALFDAVVALLGLASASAPVVLILDDLHWAAKPTLLLLRHLLRFGEHARVQVLGTYRSTDLDRSHPLAAMLADLHRDGTANRISLSGLDEDEVTAYVAEAGYQDEELGRALASVTGGNPFFLIEALRHVEESGGHWDQSTLPQGVREAVSRRLSRLAPETNKALGAAAVVGSRFALELVERVVGDDLVDVFDEACKAGIVIEEPGGRYRFNHALVRQSLLAELPSVRRMRLHQRIATTLENELGADDETLAELAYHYFECAWAGNASKAVEYCRRAADQAMARLAYEGAADLYDRALHALEEIDDELPDRADQAAELLIARCEALLAAGDVTSAVAAVSQLQAVTVDSARLAAWATCFDGQLSMLTHPERLDEVESAVGLAATRLAELDDTAGEAKAHTVRAGCLARLGRIGDCEIALDEALTAARRAREHRRVNAVLANAPLAALWGPNPVPRAGGRCLDVVRLLRITTDSPAVEATSTRCQAVLEVFRGRATTARRMIDSARRSVTELGLRHALLEVEQFAGIIELVEDDPGAAEGHLRLAYNGFRRMGLDADTAETAAMLGRACLALGSDVDADELCSESERLAGHALKASIAWRTLRAQLLSRHNEHDEARRLAEAAVALAERTDALVDHGDACLALATVLGAAGDVRGARVAAERALSLYQLKGATALTAKARRILGAEDYPQPLPREAATVKPTNACVQAGSRLIDAVNREAWDEVDQLLASCVSVESRRKIVGFARIDVPSRQWPEDMRRYLEKGMVRYNHTALAVRGERFALTRLEIGTADLTPGAPQDEMLQVVGLDAEGRLALQVKFDVEDIDAALAELDAVYARSEELHHRPAPRLENAASQVAERFLGHFASQQWDAMADMLADGFYGDDRRPVVGSGVRSGRDAQIADLQAIAELWSAEAMSTVIATRGRRLALMRLEFLGGDPGHQAFVTEVLCIVEVNSSGQTAAWVVFGPDYLDAAFAELDARYLAGEAAPHARTWLAITRGFAALNRCELPATTPGWVNIDYRRGASAPPGEAFTLLSASWKSTPDLNYLVEAVHRLDDVGAVVSHLTQETSQEGFRAEWRVISLMTFEGELLDRTEIFDETDVETAIERFEQLRRPMPHLENHASQVIERCLAHFAARDWAAMEGLFAEDSVTDDRRSLVGVGRRDGPEIIVADWKAMAEVGTNTVASTVTATRGDRLALLRLRFAGRDQRAEAFHSEVLGLVEVNSEGRIAVCLMWETDDFGAAIAELDARFVAGEASAHARVWRVIAKAYSTLNRREIPQATDDFVDVDHRRIVAVGPGDVKAYLAAACDDLVSGLLYVEAVHRLTSFGAVVTHVAYGTTRDGFNADWRITGVCAVEGELFSRYEVFDEADLGAALERFEQLSRRTTRLENVATRVYAQNWSHFAARDWAALAANVSHDYVGIDRRRVVKGEAQHGRDAVMTELKASAQVGFRLSMVGIVAIRGERLVLARIRGAGPDAETVQNDVLNVVEVDTDHRVKTSAMYDLEDFDAALAELEARYTAGEAAPYANTWSVVAGSYASIGRNEFPAMAADMVSIDHRRQRPSFASGQLNEYIRAGFELNYRVSPYVEAVHGLNDSGAVVTHAAKGHSQDGFDAEWRDVVISMVGGNVISRCELFDEVDLDVAIARFDLLNSSARKIDNRASRVYEQFFRCFEARDWAAMAAVFAEDSFTDDRRRVVGAGVLQGRDANIANMRAVADLATDDLTSTTIATRDEHLALSRVKSPAFQTEVLNVVEIDADQLVVAVVAFDADNLGAAFEELDARYLAGEAAPYRRTWTVIAEAYAGLNRRELVATAPDWVNIDHRRLSPVEAGDLTAYIREAWRDSPDIRTHIETVHALSNLGAVFTHVARGTSREGFEAEWRSVDILMVGSDVINRCERFDEPDLDAALARFEELEAEVRRLGNPASRALDRFLGRVVARDWDAIADMLAADYFTDDRRHLVGGGIYGRDAEIASVQVQAKLGLTHATQTVIAVRGERIALSRVRYSGHNQGLETFVVETLTVFEIDGDGRLVAGVAFDPDDLDAAIAELDARYLAGEAAAHARAWRAVAQVYTTLNSGEIPSTANDFVDIDYRRLAAIGAGDMKAYQRAAMDDSTDTRLYVETVHRLTDYGAVVTHVASGISLAGFAADWRITGVYTVEGDLINRYEAFDESDLDAALARFDELQRPGRSLENAASRVSERGQAYFAAEDWAAATAMVAEDFVTEDRRRVISAGIHRGRDENVASLKAASDIGFENLASTVIAIRGERLLLDRVCFSGRDPAPEPFRSELLRVFAIDAEDRVAASIFFDLEDIDAAYEELNARYRAGEAAPYSSTWSVIAALYAGFKRQELPATTRDWTYIDHRSLINVEAVDLPAFIRAGWDLTPDIGIYMEAVHRLSDLGAVVTHTARAVSREDSDVEWRMIDIFTVDGDLISRCEMFDEADLDTALARFDELDRPK